MEMRFSWQKYASKECSRVNKYDFFCVHIFVAGLLVEMTASATLDRLLLSRALVSHPIENENACFRDEGEGEEIQRRCILLTVET